MIFLWRDHDGAEEVEYVLLSAGFLGDSIDEERALLDGKTTMQQWLNDVGVTRGDVMLLCRRVDGSAELPKRVAEEFGEL